MLQMAIAPSALRSGRRGVPKSRDRACDRRRASLDLGRSMRTIQEKIGESVSKWQTCDWPVIRGELAHGRDPKNLLDWVSFEGNNAPVFRAICGYTRESLEQADMGEFTDRELALCIAVAICQMEEEPDGRPESEERIIQVRDLMRATGQSEALLSDKTLDYLMASSLVQGWICHGSAALVKQYLETSVAMLLNWLSRLVRGRLEWDPSGDPAALADMLYNRLLLVQQQGGPCQCCRGALSRVATKLNTAPPAALEEILKGGLSKSNDVRSVLKCHRKHRLEAFLERWENISLAAFLREAVRNSYDKIGAEGIKSGMIWPLLQEKYHLAYMLIAVKPCPKCHNESKSYKSWTLDSCEKCHTNLEKVKIEKMYTFVVLDDIGSYYRKGELEGPETLYWLGVPKETEMSPPSDCGSDFLDYLESETTDLKVYVAAMAVVVGARRRAEIEADADLARFREQIADGKNCDPNTLKRMALDICLGRILDNNGFDARPDLSYLDQQCRDQWASQWTEVKEEWRHKPNRPGKWAEVQDEWDGIRNPEEYSTDEDPARQDCDERGQNDPDKQSRAEIMERFWRGLKREETP